MHRIGIEDSLTKISEQCDGFALLVSKRKSRIAHVIPLSRKYGHKLAFNQIRIALLPNCTDICRVLTRGTKENFTHFIQSDETLKSQRPTTTELPKTAAKYRTTHMGDGCANPPMLLVESPQVMSACSNPSRHMPHHDIFGNTLDTFSTTLPQKGMP